jgi:hypothetical protein
MAVLFAGLGGPERKGGNIPGISEWDVRKKQKKTSTPTHSAGYLYRSI